VNRRKFLTGVSTAPLPLALAKAQQAASPNQRWIATAEALKPVLKQKQVSPVSLVEPVADSTKFLQYRMETKAPAAAVNDRLMGRGDEVVLNFGEHLTGYLSFSLVGEGRGVDAPARIKLIFGEVPAEVARPFDPYKGGLSRAWLQDEVINIDALPAQVRMPRRYAFRYLKLQVIDTSPNFKVRFGDVQATSVTSADANPAPLPSSVPASLRQIDEVSIRTLRDCMQTVFEDGPKRDRRLWIGDLRLQALTNYATFRNYPLVKRCLYLFAALPREDGMVAACVFEEPKPLRGHEYIIDYAALYPVTLLEYARASNDWQTARELWPVAKRQLEIMSGYVGSDGLFVVPPRSWAFVDWSDPLDRTAAMHSIILYCFRQSADLASKCGDEATAVSYKQLAERMTKAGRAAFYDPQLAVFVSGPKRQVSWASQAWGALAGIVTPAEGAAAFRSVAQTPEAVRPGGPYLYHYVTEAMIQCGMKREARDLIESYWGSMVANGADTFWEVYDPANPNLSPYGDVQVNSYCHAWSCTPAYLLRAGGLVG
jgi:alpha-L-rhamnosidase